MSVWNASEENLPFFFADLVGTFNRGPWRNKTITVLAKSATLKVIRTHS